jgi:EAL domain-containing protein (putative c-di-GMP-specific phosphodiesterase class I)
VGRRIAIAGLDTRPNGALPGSHEVPRPDAPPIIQRVVELTHRHLGMDVVYVSQFIGDWQYFHGVAGDPSSFGVRPEPGLPLGVTYCAEMTAGLLPRLIPDTRTESRVSDLAVTSRADIGAYIGVPLRLSDGTLFGSFCCASHRARPELTARDVQFLTVLADLLTDELDREYRSSATRRMVEQVLAQSQVVVALQPVVDLRDGRRTGVEALSRFPDSVGSPATLFPAAAAVGLGTELEELAASRAIVLTHLLGPDEFLSVNLSPRTLRSAAGLIFRSPGVDASRLVFELTEHRAVDEYDRLRGDLRELRRQGIRLAIDDAGAGYASLFHIVQLEPDIIKIDRSLVDGASTDRARRSVIRGFVGLAADIGATVIGEGVEHRADLDVLRDLGVDAAQGYLLGRPTVDHDRIRAGFGHNEWIAALPSVATAGVASGGCVPHPRADSTLPQKA